MRHHIPTEQLTVGQQVQAIGSGWQHDVQIIDLGQRQYGIGAAYSYPAMTVEHPDGSRETISSLMHTFASAEYERDAWCPECRTGSSVEDEFIESRYERSGEYEFTVTKLACGHDVISGEHCVGAAPGAPYAGPQAVVAASARPRDLHAAATAQARQSAAAADPWSNPDGSPAW